MPNNAWTNTGFPNDEGGATFGPASKLAFGVEPSDTFNSASISPSVTVAVEDSLGHVVTSSTASITVAIGTNPSSGTLSGTVTRNAVSGIATFNDLAIDQNGAGYTLTASSSGLAGATSSAFNITTSVAQTATVYDECLQSLAPTATVYDECLQAITQTATVYDETLHFLAPTATIYDEALQAIAKAVTVYGEAWRGVAQGARVPSESTGIQKYSGILYLSGKWHDANFGAALVGQTAVRVFLVVNDTLAMVTVSSVTITGANAGDFSYTLTRTAYAPDDEGILTVTFEPTSHDAEIANLNLNLS
jgi:hypothetical protein